MKNKNAAMHGQLDENQQTDLRDHHHHSNEKKNCCGDCKGHGSRNGMNLKSMYHDNTKEQPAIDRKLQETVWIG